MRAAMMQVGRSLLETLLSTQDGHRGQRVDCGSGHLAEFVGYRDKGIDTVLGRVGCAAPTTTAGPATVGWYPATTNWARPGRRCRPGCAGWWPGSPPWRRSRRRGRPAGRRGRHPAVHQARGAIGRGRRAGRRSSTGPIVTGDPGRRGERVPALAVAGHALHRRRRHRDSGGARRRAGPGRQERRRAGPHPRGQARLPVHPNHHRRPGPPSARPGHLQLRAHPRPGRAVQHARARRGPPPRRRAHRQPVILGDGAMWIWKMATKILPRPPRLSTSTTPANTCTT